MTGRMDRRRAYAAVVVGTLGYTCLMFVWFSLPAYLSTIIDNLGLSGTQAGVVAGAVPLTYIPIALFSGVVVDRIGPGRSLAAGVLIYGTAQVARSAATGFPSLLAATLAIGVGATAITFGLPKLVSVLFPPDETGLPSSIYLVGASTGTASVFAVGRPVLGPLLGGWRPLFFWSGVVAIAYGLLWLGVAHRLGIDARNRAANDADDADSSLSPAAIARDLKLVLTHRELQLVVVVGTMYLLIAHGTQSWLPTLLEARGYSAGRAGRMTSLLVAANVVGVVTVPAVADRLGVRRTALIGCGLIATVGLSGVISSGLGLLLLGSVLVTGFGFGGLSPLIRAIPPELEGIGARLTGTAVGFIFAVGEIGGFLGPVLVGTLYDRTGSYAPGLGLLAVAGLVVAVAGSVLRFRYGDA
ncbi:MFS transporter [Natrinema thermotolerans]|uniref:MFS transporter n=1 Tax=Natrinema thermotolerans TaxID=121872 RepID=A0AAF0T480_9EURY|nr:MFS transporter [Natrinema thermotolerans]QCC59264.1 MFS transporter [Natrinema thermotolerans]WMT06229.1 MFS transporter [Natrinema thermotolerans]